jgi:hypothetical protein
MADITNAWIEWWNTETVVSPSTWHRNMEIFVTAWSRSGLQRAGYYLGRRLRPRLFGGVSERQGERNPLFDTSQRYLDMCKEKFAGQKTSWFIDSTRATIPTFVSSGKKLLNYSVSERRAIL